MTTLSGRLLGSPEITFGGQPLPFRTRKALALMIYLVIEREMHSREALMALLWPEFPAPKAAVTLRVTLSRLRQALRPAGDVLIAAEGKVGFDFNSPIDLDLAWLSAAVLPETPSDSLTNILDGLAASINGVKERYRQPTPHRCPIASRPPRRG